MKDKKKKKKISTKQNKTKIYRINLQTHNKLITHCLFNDECTTNHYHYHYYYYYYYYYCFIVNSTREQKGNKVIKRQIDKMQRYKKQNRGEKEKKGSGKFVHLPIKYIYILLLLLLFFFFSFSPLFFLFVFSNIFHYTKKKRKEGIFPTPIHLLRLSIFLFINFFCQKRPNENSPAPIPLVIVVLNDIYKWQCKVGTNNQYIIGYKQTRLPWVLCFMGSLEHSACPFFFCPTSLSLKHCVRILSQ